MSSQYYHIKRHVAPCQHIRHYPHATANAQEDKLHLVIKQYIPLDNRHPIPGDLTIIACHGSGLAKELYEPLWDEIYKISKSSKAFSIRAIWAVDIAQQGESGLLNESKLGNDRKHVLIARSVQSLTSDSIMVRPRTRLTWDGQPFQGRYAHASRRLWTQHGRQSDSLSRPPSSSIA